MDIQTEANAFIMKGCSGATAAEGMTESEKERWSIECKAKERPNVSKNAQINLNLGKRDFTCCFAMQDLKFCVNLLIHNFVNANV